MRKSRRFFDTPPALSWISWLKRHIWPEEMKLIPNKPILSQIQIHNLKDVFFHIRLIRDRL